MPGPQRHHVLQRAWRALRSRPLTYSLVLSVGVGGGMIALLTGVQRLAALPLFITSWASSSALIISAPGSRAARPLTVIVGHILCGAIGLIASDGIASRPLAIVVGFALCMLVMLQLRMVHPPAAANAAIAVTTTAPHVPLMAGWAGGGLCLFALAFLMRSTLGPDELQS